MTATPPTLAQIPSLSRHATCACVLMATRASGIKIQKSQRAQLFGVGRQQEGKGKGKGETRQRGKGRGATRQRQRQRVTRWSAAVLAT